MSAPVQWYRSGEAPPPVGRSAKRALRDWIRACLPEPAVRGKTMVVYCRQTLKGEFHGLFSEFHSVLGAIAYASGEGAAGVRVDYRSPLYLEPERGPNWWTYFFEHAVVPLDGRTESGTRDEVHLNRVVTKYGRHGGFADIVQGETPYLYPMTYGLSRGSLARLLADHVGIRDDIRTEASRFAAERFEPGAFVVGVHYRGTDATHHWTGGLNHYRTAPVSYAAYCDEIRRVLDERAPRRYQVFVATDEVDFLEAMRQEFGDRIVEFGESPRVRAGSQAIHLDRGLAVSNYQKGKSALVDALVLASTGYLVKGRSNLSDASLVFNPDLPYSFCPDVVLR